MPPPLPPDETLEQVAKLRLAGNSQQQIGDLLGRPRTTIQHWLNACARKGLLGTDPVMAGYELRRISTQRGPNGEVQREWITQAPEHGEQFAIPEGHQIKGVSALVDAEGRTVQQWIKTKEGTLDPLEVAQKLKETFADYKPAAMPIPAPTTQDHLLTLLPCNDWHINLLVWGEENGENWDLKIAEKTIGEAVENTIARSPPSGHCIVLGGGDLLHADNSENKTAKSGNVLDVDGRYQKGLLAASRLMVRTADAALRQHGHVTIRILPGNHDEHSAVAVAYFLLAWYRNEPRVTVDVDPSLFFWHRFGHVMLGATHGHTVKIAQMPGIMAHRRAEDWGATKFRYIHGFHLHHSAKIATEGNGAICEVHQAPIPQDSWHFGAGFISGRSLQAITYHRKYGEIGRVRTAILDASDDKS